jgi:hypothetical protein
MKTKTRKPRHAPVMHPSCTRLRECACGSMGGDHSPGDPVIRRVKILGPKSRNGRIYTDECITEAVNSGTYEGAKVYFDHRPKGKPGDPLPDRSVVSRFGTLENVRKEGDSAYADLRYNPGHLYAGTVLGWVESDPHAVGLSHDVNAERHFDADGTMIVTRIAECYSIDLVESPATTQGLFESATPEESPVDDLLAPETPAVEDGAETPQTLAQKIGDLIAHIADDQEMSPEEKDKKLKAVMKLLSAGCEDEPEEEEAPLGEEEEEEMEKAEESVKKKGDKYALRILEGYKQVKLLAEGYALREAAIKLDIRSRKMCAEANLPEKAISKTFIEQLVEAKSDDRRRELIADRKAASGVPKTPTSQGPSKLAGKKPTVDDLLARSGI